MADLIGGAGADTLIATSGGIGRIHGGAGDDLIQAGQYAPPPELHGGPGADTIIGGAGLDDVFFDEATGLIEVWLDRPAAPARSGSTMSS